MAQHRKILRQAAAIEKLKTILPRGAMLRALEFRRDSNFSIVEFSLVPPCKYERRSLEDPKLEQLIAHAIGFQFYVKGREGVAVRYNPLVSGNDPVKIVVERLSNALVGEQNSLSVVQK